MSWPHITPGKRHVLCMMTGSTSVSCEARAGKSCSPKTLPRPHHNTARNISQALYIRLRSTWFLSWWSLQRCMHCSSFSGHHSIFLCIPQAMKKAIAVSCHFHILSTFPALNKMQTAWSLSIGKIIMVELTDVTWNFHAIGVWSVRLHISRPWQYLSLQHLFSKENPSYPFFYMLCLTLLTAGLKKSTTVWNWATDYLIDKQMH